ncbi:MAG TPA: MBL fold metallo-hydrolase [Dehalococcoidales bacterium]|nr:MBL fold metallo-hydrolase [Dehalococcoidales bacterium]
MTSNGNLEIERLQLGPFGTNAYVLTCRQTMDSVLVDAPAEANRLIESLEGTNPRYILLTHSHMDHIGALAEIRSRLKIPLAAHAADAGILSSPPEIQLNDSDTVSFGNIKLKILHTPGHTPGSLCFQTGKYLISGDTIFPGGPGKTGSPGDLQKIIKSITDKIFILDDDTRVYPGHGEPTVLKKEKEEFAVFSSRPHHPNLCGDVLWLSA